VPVVLVEMVERVERVEVERVGMVGMVGEESLVSTPPLGTVTRPFRQPNPAHPGFYVKAVGG
jgi:hypothetical protein